MKRASRLLSETSPTARFSGCITAVGKGQLYFTHVAHFWISTRGFSDPRTQCSQTASSDSQWRGLRRAWYFANICMMVLLLGPDMAGPFCHRWCCGGPRCKRNPERGFFSYRCGENRGMNTRNNSMDQKGGKNRQDNILGQELMIHRWNTSDKRGSGKSNRIQQGTERTSK